MKNIRFFSLRLPFGIYVHYASGRKIGESRPAYGKGLVHYNRRKKLIGKIVRNFFGEPNHYDLHGRCIGYSRKIGFAKVAHFDRNGIVIGYTYRIFGFLFITALKTQNIFTMRR